MAIELSEQEQLRRQSLKALRDLGIEPYPAARYEVTATAREIAENYDDTKHNYDDVRIAGRIMSRRIMGSASFFELQDHTGRIQVNIPPTPTPATAFDPRRPIHAMSAA